MKWTISTILILVLCVKISGQQQILRSTQVYEKDTTSYLNYRSQDFVHTVLPNKEIDSLRGEVRINQDSLFMRCDRAVIIDRINAVAVSRVIIVHEDSIFIFADSLIYDGKEKLATLFGEVIFQDGKRTLHTTKLVYDVKTKIGRYEQGGTLVDSKNATLVSKRGQYDVESGMAAFKTNVRYQDSLRSMQTDSIVFDYRRNRLIIVEKTRILQDTANLECSSGIYDIDTENAILSEDVSIRSGARHITSGLLHYRGDDKSYAFFLNPRFTEGNDIEARADTILYKADSSEVTLLGRAVYRKGEQWARADRISYDEEKGTYRTIGRSRIEQPDRELMADDIANNGQGLTTARGRVVMHDSIKGVRIWCDRFEVLDSTNYIKAYNLNSRPLIMYEMDTSFLLIRADTIVTYTAQIDSVEVDFFNAFHNVEFTKSDVAGISDTLSFNTGDSTFVLYRSAYLWSGQTQMSGDTIYLHLSGQSLDRVVLQRNGFVVSKAQEGHYNQIKANHMVLKFANDQLKSSEVDGNTELVYYVKGEESNYVGINMTRSSRMNFQFENDEITKARYYNNPESNIYEYTRSMDLSAFILQGFNWIIEKKPIIEFSAND